MVCIRVISLCHLHTIQRVLFEFEKKEDLGKVGFSFCEKPEKGLSAWLLAFAICRPLVGIKKTTPGIDSPPSLPSSDNAVETGEC